MGNIKHKFIIVIIICLSLALTTTIVFARNFDARTNPNATIPCVEVGDDGVAGPYPCRQVDLMGAPAIDFSGGLTGNDLWGWTSPTGREFALVGHSQTTSFIDVTDPMNPANVGYLPSGSVVNLLWRDMKTLGDYMLVVADFPQGSTHGMQIFDLTQLPDTPPILPVEYTESARYEEFDSAHNIVTNDDTNFAYAVGSDTCAGGLHMINMIDPLNPTFAGCFDEDGYTHDAQCVVYHGPDTTYQGREICFNSNEDTTTVVDVTDKTNPVMLSRVGYATSAYAHQGWLTEDHAYFVSNDEIDETDGNVPNTATYVWDVRDLDNIAHIGTYLHTTNATDHNMYIKGGLLYQANYEAGLRILDLTNIVDGELSTVGFFDTVPTGDTPATSGGSWSVYPYFESGNIIVNEIFDNQLFILRETLPNLAIDQAQTVARQGGDPMPGDDVTYDIDITNSGTVTATNVVVTNTVNGQDFAVGTIAEIAVGATETIQHTYTVMPTQDDCDGLEARATARSAEKVGAGVNLPVETNVQCAPTAVTMQGATIGVLLSPRILPIVALVLVYLTLTLVASTSQKK